jgi:hypothetical protein
MQNNVSKGNEHAVMWICEAIADKYYAYRTCCVNISLNKSNKLKYSNNKKLYIIKNPCRGTWGFSSARKFLFLFLQFSFIRCVRKGLMKRLLSSLYVSLLVSEWPHRVCIFNSLFGFSTRQILLKKTQIMLYIKTLVGLWFIAIICHYKWCRTFGKIWAEAEKSVDYRACKIVNFEWVF